MLSSDFTVWCALLIINTYEVPGSLPPQISPPVQVAWDPRIKQEFHHISFLKSRHIPQVPGLEQLHQWTHNQDNIPFQQICLWKLMLSPQLYIGSNSSMKFLRYICYHYSRIASGPQESKNWNERRIINIWYLKLELVVSCFLNTYTFLLLVYALHNSYGRQ